MLSANQGLCMLFYFCMNGSREIPLVCLFFVIAGSFTSTLFSPLLLFRRRLDMIGLMILNFKAGMNSDVASLSDSSLIL